MTKRPLKELIRSAEGEITRSEFRRGAVVTLAISLAVLAVAWGIRVLSGTMDWMTVVIAPVFGVLLFMAASSLIFFWYCLFAKRLRALGWKIWIAPGWLIFILLAATGGLIAFENASLQLATGGWLTYIPALAALFGLAAIAGFIGMLAIGYFGPDT